MNCLETILTVISVAVAVVAGLMLIAAGLDRNIERDQERHEHFQAGSRSEQ